MMKLINVKTGIKKVVAKDGSERFYPISKGYALGIYVGQLPIFGDDGARAICNNNKFSSLDGAQQAIDQHLESLKRDKKRKRDKKVARKEFIKYP